LASKSYKLATEFNNKIKQHSYMHPLLMASGALYLSLVEKKHDEALELINSSIDRTNQNIIDSHSPINIDKPLRKTEKDREYEIFGLDIIVPYNVKLLILTHIPSRENELFYEFERDSLIQRNYIAKRIYADLRFHELPHYKNVYRNEEHIAIHLYSSIIEKFPEDPYAYNQRAVLKFKYPIVREISSIDDFSTAINLDPKNPILLFNRAINLKVIGEFDNAMKDFQTIIALFPEDAFIWHQTAKLYFNQFNDYHHAIDAISKAIEIYPDYPFYYSFRAKAHEMLNQYEEAIDDYLNAIKNTSEDFLSYLKDGSYAWISELFADDPNLKESYKFASLESEYKNSSLYQYSLYDEDYACLYDRNGYHNSLNRDLIESEINILFKNNKSPKEKYQSILELNVSEINELTNQIVVDKENGQYHLAMEKVNILSLRDPNKIDLYYQKHELANLLEISSQKYLDKMLHVEGNNPQIYLTYIHTIKDKEFITANEYRKLINLYTKLIEFYPKEWNYLFQRGKILIEIEEYQLAEADIQKAYKISPMNVDVLFLKGNIHYFNKQFDKSIKTMTKIIEINEGFLDAYKRRGRAYHKLKMYQKAANDYYYYLHKKPNDIVTLHYLSLTCKFVEVDDEYKEKLGVFLDMSIDSFIKHFRKLSEKFEVIGDMMSFPEKREGYFD